MILTGTGMIFTPGNNINTITLEWSDVTYASDWMNNLIGQSDISSVANWNTAFDLPTNGTPFTRVSVPDSTHIILSNPGNINTTPYQLFSVPSIPSPANELISIVDTGILLHIGDSCFRYNTGLISASFAEVVELDADSPFAGCEYLETVSIPKLAYTNHGGFEFCNSLQSVDFPLLTYIADNLFYQSGLSSINAPLVQYIQDNAFTSTNLVVVDFPNATYVGDEAFSGCKIVSVNLPAAVSVGARAFQSTFPESLSSIELPSCVSVGEGCFQYCHSLIEVSLPVCTDLGGSVGNNNVFDQIASPSPTGIVTLTIPIALMTCNSGQPDGDIQYLQSKLYLEVIHPIQIGTQTWSLTNLNVTKYANGDIIPEITDETEWAAATRGAWCYYNNDSSQGQIYGKLYNGYAVNDPRGLAPSGWHIPTDPEWGILSTYLGGNSVAGGKMKEGGTAHWDSPNTGATNTSGFTALPGGTRNIFAQFLSINQSINLWSSTTYDTESNWNYKIFYNGPTLNRFQGAPIDGFSVRLVKGILKNGSSPASAGNSAYQIKTDYPASTDGLYWIKNSHINGGDPFQIYADMTTAGGGWTLIMQNNYDSWTTANGILRNQLTPPSTLATEYGADSSANYSILAWADYLKSSPSGFQYMLDANTRRHYGGIWQANEAYSFVGIMDVAAYELAGYNTDGSSAYFGTPDFAGVISGSNGFRQNITEIQKFPTNDGTWDYNNGGLEHRMPWYDDTNSGNPTIGNAVITTTHDDGGSWWGTLITNSNGGWHPSPWQNDAGMNGPGVIWYWVR